MYYKLLLVFCAAAVLSSCNTVHGFGEDMSVAGSTVSNSAERAQSGY